VFRPWCDTFVSDELHVAIVMGRFSIMLAGGMQADLAAETVCYADGACFRCTLSPQLAYHGTLQRHGSSHLQVSL
jgi:hypothetical protein